MMRSRCCGDQARTATTEPPIKYDARLRGVARALSAVAPAGATIPRGTSARFPPPGLALREEEEAVSLPLLRTHSAMVKSRATHESAAAWSVPSDALQLRNSEWPEFIEDCVTSMRRLLAIPPSATIKTTLRKLVLMEAGATLPVGQQRRREQQGDGVFGSFVVALPGAFEGGSIASKSSAQDEAQVGSNEANSTTWQPGARKNSYNITYAAFYERCTYQCSPVTSGAALCLVYDLVMATPRDVPYHLASDPIQEWVNTSLAAYFDVTPVDVVDRLKISADAWRTVGEFAAERHFVYFVGSKHQLHGDERKIAESLQAFCAKSGGQYVLYFADVLCSREMIPNWAKEAIAERERGIQREADVTLKSPWFKFGESEPAEYPPVYLRATHDILPLGRAKEFSFDCRSRFLMSSVDKSITDQLYNSCTFGETFFEIFTTHALVVQPAPIEQSQMARLPIQRAVEKLRRLLTNSHEEAVAYARRVIYHRPDWLINGDTCGLFVRALMDIDDRELFLDFLQRLELLETVKSDKLLCGIDHFAWAACEPTLVKRVLSTPTWGGRVLLVISLVGACWAPEQHRRLLDALFSLHPWTDVHAPSGSRHTKNRVDVPDARHIQILLITVHEVSCDRLFEAMNVLAMRDMVCHIAPALIQLTQDRWLRETLWPALEDALYLLQIMMVDYCSTTFAEIRVPRPRHCRKCEELQRFLSSSAIELTVKYLSVAQRQHIEDVLLDATKDLEANIEVSMVETKTLRLCKNPESPTSRSPLFARAREQVAEITEMLR